MYSASCGLVSPIESNMKGLGMTLLFKLRVLFFVFCTFHQNLSIFIISLVIKTSRSHVIFKVSMQHTWEEQN